MLATTSGSHTGLQQVGIASQTCILHCAVNTSSPHLTHSSSSRDAGKSPQFLSGCAGDGALVGELEGYSSFLQTACAIKRIQYCTVSHTSQKSLAELDNNLLSVYFDAWQSVMTLTHDIKCFDVANNTTSCHNSSLHSISLSDLTVWVRSLFDYPSARQRIWLFLVS